MPLKSRVATSLRSAVVASTFALALALVPAVARAQSSEAAKEACATSYEGGQSLRAKSQLAKARIALAKCSQTCPAELANDCVGWLAEVESSLPSVVVTVRGLSDSDRASARARIEGVDDEAPVDGVSPLRVDAGRHTLRVELADGRTQTVALEIAPGDRRRPVDVAFTGPLAGPNASDPIGPEAPGPERDANASANAGLGVAPLVFGGVGAAALLAGGVLAISGHVQRGELEQSCAPRCAASDVDEIRTTWTIGAVAGGIGTALVGTAVVLAVTSRSNEPDPVAALQPRSARGRRTPRFVAAPFVSPRERVGGFVIRARF